MKKEDKKSKKITKIPYMMNRELSWLKFNERVLNEAGNPRVPLAERLTFAAIYQSNLDEFYRVRVGTLMDQMESSEVVRENKTNMTSEEQVKAILKATRELDLKKAVIYEQLMGELEQNGIIYEGEIELSKIGFCKIEAQQGCLTGSFCIPKLLDVQGSRYRILFFITRDKVVLVDDDGFSKRLVARINRRKSTRYKTKEIFLFNFIAEFMNRDLEQLAQFEKSLMELEETVHSGHTENFQSSILTIRRDLLILRGYYDEIMDVGKALEENEKCYFVKKHLKYFGTISDRAERLMNKTSHLLEYAGQVNDAYLAKVDVKQNSNMQFLTIISTVFFPLTLITGWYGMNFQNMPELESGYPGVILLSVIVVVTCIIVFKIKKIF